MPIETLEPRNQHVEVIPQLKRPENPRRFSTNDKLEFTVDQISQFSPNWDKILAEFRRVSAEKQVRNYNALSLPGAFLEIHIDMALQQLAESDPLINTRPIPSTLTTASYIYEPGLFGGSIRISKKENELGKKEVVAEIDSLITVDQLPVVIETRMTKYATRHQQSRFHVNLIGKRLESKITPLSELFGELGYVALANPEAMNQSSETQQQFREDGGILQALPFSYKEFVGTSLDLGNRFLDLGKNTTVILSEESVDDLAAA